MKPKIGILARPIISSSGREMLATYKEVIDVIIKSGGIPVQLFPPNSEDYLHLSSEEILPLTEEEKEVLHQMVEDCDGILLQGGSDFYAYDVEVAKYTHQRDIPTLGICLGMQTLGYAHHGQLESVSSLALHQSTKIHAHNIQIDSQSKLYHILGQGNLVVNSRHKDCVKETSLSISAYSSDGTIEAVEDPEKSFYLGIQWHPETMWLEVNEMKPLFQAFIDASKKELKNGDHLIKRKS